MILLRQSRVRNEAPTEEEALGPTQGRQDPFSSWLGRNCDPYLKNAFPTPPLFTGVEAMLIALTPIDHEPTLVGSVDLPPEGGCGSPVVKVSNHGRHVMSSIPVPLKTRRVGQRCTLNLSRAETSSRWCGG
ncbi:uncharacterized protein TNCV_3667941 [Trichonephila clavipes]|nr:uncharacterized protein TNCV_3667941 [Trichonephila clavipes]